MVTQIKRITLVAALAVFICVAKNAVAQQSKPIIIKSPDAAIQFLLSNDNGKLTYSVDFKKKIIIQPSALSLLVNGKMIGEKAVTGKLQ